MTIEVPREVPAGRVILTFTPERGEHTRRLIEELKRSELPRPQTIEEAIQQAKREAANPDRIPISRYFGVMKDNPLPQSGVEYQRSIRDEWD